MYLWLQHFTLDSRICNSDAGLITATVCRDPRVWHQTTACVGVHVHKKVRERRSEWMFVFVHVNPCRVTVLLLRLTVPQRVNSITKQQPSVSLFTSTTPRLSPSPQLVSRRLALCFPYLPTCFILPSCSSLTGVCHVSFLCSLLCSSLFFSYLSFHLSQPPTPHSSHPPSPSPFLYVRGGSAGCLLTSTHPAIPRLWSQTGNWADRQRDKSWAERRERSDSLPATAAGLTGRRWRKKKTASGCLEVQPGKQSDKKTESLSLRDYQAGRKTDTGRQVGGRQVGRAARHAARHWPAELRAQHPNRPEGQQLHGW